MADFATLLGPLIEHSPTVHFAYHLQTDRVVYLSGAYTDMLDADPQQVNDDLPALLASLHPDDRAHLAVQLSRVPAGEVTTGVELRRTRPDGTRQWLCMRATQVQAEDGAVYISGTVDDITRAKEYMDSAHKYNAKKNAVLEILSHDLAGPLLLVQQLAEHVAHQSESYHDASLNELVQLMQTTCQDSVALIRDFVDSEFLESANVVLKRERMDLVSWAELVLEEYRLNAEKLAKRFELHAPVRPLYVSCDKSKFEQVLNNLISNAMKFTPDGGLIELVVEPSRAGVRLTVADNGIGIPEHLQPLLFDKFTKARRPGLRGEKTTGLGMSVIKTIVELHQGTISFTSQEGRGSAFRIELPAVTADAPQ